MTSSKTRRTRFDLSELQPLTGNPTPSEAPPILIAATAKIAAFNAIYIHNPSHRKLLSALDQLMRLGMATPGQRQFAVRSLGPSGSGKTTTAEAFQRIVARREETGGANGKPHSVLIVPLESGCSVRSLWVSINLRLGETMIKRSDTEETLRQRAYRAIQRLGIKLIIIDEVQHLDTARGRGDVTDSLKRILDDGIVPLALLGVNDAEPMLRRNDQLANRMLPPADIVPLSAGQTQDRRDFEGFLSRLDAGMLQAKLVRRLSKFDEVLTAACLMEVTQGILGRATNLIRIAYRRSICRSADHVEICDLAWATSDWAIKQSLAVHNPFRSGLRPAALPIQGRA